jgi:hypothetical protein
MGSLERSGVAWESLCVGIGVANQYWDRTLLRIPMWIRFSRAPAPPPVATFPDDPIIHIWGGSGGVGPTPGLLLGVYDGYEAVREGKQDLAGQTGKGAGLRSHDKARGGIVARLATWRTLSLCEHRVVGSIPTRQVRFSDILSF